MKTHPTLVWAKLIYIYSISTEESRERFSFDELIPERLSLQVLQTVMNIPAPISEECLDQKRLSSIFFFHVTPHSGLDSLIVDIRRSHPRCVDKLAAHAAK